MNFKQKLSFFACGCFFIVLAQIGLYLASQWVTAQEDETESAATVPQLMNYQGFLSEDGLKLNNTVSLTFSIYDAETGGTALWTETQPQVLVQNGLFNVILGSAEPLPTTVFQQAERYLGIEVNASGQELSPRQRLTSVAYAFNADFANYAATALNKNSIVSGALTLSGPLSSAETTVTKTITGIGFKPGCVLFMSTGSVITDGVSLGNHDRCGGISVVDGFTGLSGGTGNIWVGQSPTYTATNLQNVIFRFSSAYASFNVTCTDVSLDGFDLEATVYENSRPSWSWSYDVYWVAFP